MKKVLKWTARGVAVAIAGVVGVFAYGAVQAKRASEADLEG